MEKDLIDQSIEYILEHFEGDISVRDVADHFHYSEAHFSRAFKRTTGESVYKFIKRLKMDQSAVDIKLIRDKPITDIGLDYGYSASNYSSAFKKHHNVSPAEFRKSINVTGMPNPFYREGASGFDTFENYAKKIQIRELEDVWVICERVIGNYIDLKEKWPLFLEANRAQLKADTLLIERFYDDPAITDLNSCIYDICMTADKDCTPDNRMKINGGRFAVYRFEGEIQDIFCAVQGVFSVWLPKSGFVMDERYGLNIYRKMDGNTVAMDLCIPIK